MSYETYLAHHGIKGMHWGVRRYQNPDGSIKHPKKSMGQRVSEYHHWRKNARRLRDEREALASYHIATKRTRYSKGYELANKDIAKKYGEKAVKDIDRIEREDGVAIIGSCLAAIGTVGVLAALNWK